jgi:conjugal transfer mating pair stabilization protein TraN
MVKMIIIVSFAFSIPCLASMRGTKQIGKEWGQKRVSSAFDLGKKFNAKDLLAKDLKDQTFDAEEAARKVENRTVPRSETLDFLTSQEVQNNQRRKLFQEDELFIKTSEHIFTGKSKEHSADWNEESGYVLHTCKQAGDPIVISTERTLNVHVNSTPEELAKICQGHTIEVKVKRKDGIEKTKKKLKKKYKSDPTIKPKSVEVTLLYAHPTSPYYIFKVYYEHIDNAEGCGKCKKKRIKEASYEEASEEWIYDNQELWNLARSLDSTIIEHVCVDKTPSKMINGKSVSRQCWKERLTFFYQFPATSDCNFLKAKNCEQIKQECIEYNSSVCTQWQLTFRCIDKIKLTSIPFDYDPSEETFEYAPNQSFSEVAAKLAVFHEVKKEMEKSKTFDVRDLEIFQGKRMSCSKNVADELMYDCCFNYSGLAKQIGLAKCNADEISLAEMREQGLCRYIGHYEEKFLDLWKSRDEHVFCCFPSKLSRIVQEQGRDQLDIKWGTAEEPNCRGFKTDELSRLDFSKMDLSEICKDFVKKMPEDMPERLKSFQDRLQQDIERSEVKK